MTSLRARITSALFFFASLFIFSACGRVGFDSDNSPQLGLNKLVRPVASEETNKDLLQARVERVNATYYFMMGKYLSSKGRSADALVAFDRAKGVDENSAEIHYGLSQEYMKKGMLAEGAASAKKALELNPKYKEAKIYLANLYATAKKYEEAGALFAELVQEWPADEEILLYSALLEIEQKDFRHAETRLRKFIQENPDSAMAYFYLGRLQQELRRNGEALKSYTKAIEIRPNFVQAGTYLGFLQEDLNDKKGAQQTYEWLAQNTDDSVFHKKLGQIYLENNELERAQQSFENFERVEPKDLNNQVKLGLLYIELKHPERAVKKFRSILAESPESDSIRFYLGAVLEQVEEPSEALKEYAAIPMTSKLFSDALKRRIYLLSKAKKNDDSWALIEKSLGAKDLDSTLEEDLFEAGIGSLEAAQKTKEALGFADRGLEKFQKSEKLLLSKAALLERLGRADEAIETVQKILDINPKSASALNFIGYLWADKGQNLDTAENYINRALKLKPKDPFITDSLGWLHFKRGRYEKAFSTLKEAFDSRPDEAVIADHLGDVLAKMGRFEEARAYYETALNLGIEKESDRTQLQKKLEQIQKNLGSSCLEKNSLANKSLCSSELRDKRAPASESPTERKLP